MAGRGRSVFKRRIVAVVLLLVIGCSFAPKSAGATDMSEAAPGPPMTGEARQLLEALGLDGEDEGSTIMVPLNILPFGFRLGGHKDTDLHAWLRHVDHMLPARVVHPGLHGGVRTATIRPEVSFRYNVRIVNLASQVEDVVRERFIEWTRFGGVDSSARRVYCVNAQLVEELLEGLVASVLPQTGTGYYLVVFHTDLRERITKALQDAGPDSAVGLGPPLANGSTVVYGYRDGLCPVDLAQSAATDFVQEAVNHYVRAESSAAADPDLFVEKDIGPTVDVQHQGDADQGVTEIDATEASKVWALERLQEPAILWTTLHSADISQVVLGDLRGADDRRKRLLFHQLKLAMASGKRSGGSAGRIVHGLREGVGVSTDASLGPSFMGPQWGGLSETISENYVGSGRVAWLDLGAGPFTWGPGFGRSGAKRGVALLEPCLDGQSLCAQGDLVSAAVSGFMKQVLTPPGTPLSRHGSTSPPSAALARNPSSSRRLGWGAPPPLTVDDFFKHPQFQRITYRLFIISVHASEDAAVPQGPRLGSQTTHSQYDPVGPEGLSVQALRTELLLARQPFQDVSFTVHHVDVDDDPALAVAYAMALRHAMAPRMSASGTYGTEMRPYLDAAVVVDLVMRIRGPEAPIYASGTASKPTSLDVPILLYSVDSHPPVLVNKYHQAVAAKGVVVATQSPQIVWPSRVVGNGEDLLLNLRDPSGAIVRAALEIVGGVLPSHVGVELGPSSTANRPDASPSLAAVVDSWDWAVGPSVTAMCSESGGLVTTTTLDAMYRHQIADVLASSTAAFMAARSRLGASLTGTVDNLFQQDFGVPLRQAVFKQHSLRRQVEAHASRLDFAGAFEHVKQLVVATEELLRLSNQASAASVGGCDPELDTLHSSSGMTTPTLIGVWPAVSIILAAFVVFVLGKRLSSLVLPSGGRKRKPHIN